MSGEPSPLESFSGVARLFPLPNLVMFPSVIQPLHIFEPRYRQMTTDALGGDRLLTITLLQPGWEENYDGQPAIHQVGCLGKIVADQKLTDGRFNLLLRGLARVRIQPEVSSDKPYRLAPVEILEDVELADARLAGQYRCQLAELIPLCLLGQKAVLEQFQKLLESDLTLGSLCDIFSFALPMDVTLKQTLLEQVDVEQRVAILVEHLRNSAPSGAALSQGRKFPPDFSTN